ncbi:DUF6192 family protein [Streptomyces olindensis]|uniref:DUF6192 family protein n=1 Tax=Streptomyces olindensis TaxID=358823 RepID=UPI0036A5AC20
MVSRKVWKIRSRHVWAGGRVRRSPPAARAIEHTIEYLDLVGSYHGFVATLGRLVPQLRGQEFTEDE